MNMISIRRSTVLAQSRSNSIPSSALVRVGIAFDASVQTIQKALMAQGYSVGPDGADGKNGPNTQAAIRKFKIDHGLPANSTIDSSFRTALASAMGMSTPSSTTTSPAAQSSYSSSSMTSSASSSDGNTPLMVIGAALLVGGLVWWLV